MKRIHATKRLELAVAMYKRALKSIGIARALIEMYAGKAPKGHSTRKRVSSNE